MKVLSVKVETFQMSFFLEKGKKSFFPFNHIVVKMSLQSNHETKEFRPHISIKPRFFSGNTLDFLRIQFQSSVIFYTFLHAENF